MVAHPDGTCPVTALLPQGPVNNVDLAVAAARDQLAAEPQRHSEISAVLIHLLDHGTDHRPKVARAIATLVPEARPQAAARVRGYLADRASDPVPAGYPDWYTPNERYEKLALVITLGLLDPAQAPAARAAFAEADTRMVLNFGDGYAALGPDYAREVLARLTETAAGGRGEAEQAAATMAKLDAAYHLEACQALATVVAGGVPVGLVARPLTALSPEAVQVAVSIAIASLLLDPASYLSVQSGPDLVDVIRAAGEQHASQIDAALWTLVRDSANDVKLRLEAAAKLPPSSRTQAESQILGILDAPSPDEKASASPIRAAVADAWRRIELALATYAPDSLSGLGAPATQLDVEVAEAKLGYPLPEDFKASCLIHGSIDILGADQGDCAHIDLARLPDMRDAMDWGDEWRACVPLLAEPDGSYVVLDLDPERVPGRLLYSDQGGEPDPDDVRAPNWLSVLERFATRLEADALADAELAAFIAAVRQDDGPSARELGAAELRRGQRQRVQAQPRGPEVGTVTDLPVGPDQVPVRVYRPTGEPRATVVFLHGGMWVIGDLESHDRACRRLVEAVGVTVVAVDYRRAPEHVWPAAVDDAVQVLRWAYDDGGATTGTAAGPLVVMGDSAGGNLATLACLRLRDEGRPLPALQVLLYPNTDLTLSQPSVKTKATGWGLDADAVAWGAELWVPDPGRRADPTVSPLFADLHGLPPAVVVTAEHDPLRDEGDAYAARLTAAGVPVRHRCEAGQVHGFLTLDLVSPAAASAGSRVFADLADLL
ncbi:alpha/beta hydrolase fold domain-containing protein [Catenulispora rubra]|uniref:alpha/beta hydrolase fold domain-containing protein n=1 Tax=Catenulispora rubra TaxID=280293 RepID=UPI002B277C1C|nr:alpha/beta hydrolase fold domain-containing protein [Catenulispora rubra]